MAGSKCILGQVYTTFVRSFMQTKPHNTCRTTFMDAEKRKQPYEFIVIYTFVEQKAL